MKRGMLTTKSGIFKKNPRPYVMLVLSHFIAYTIFPSIIIYKHLPGDWFASLVKNREKNTETVAWMGEVNVGSFLISYGIAILLTSKKFRPDQVEWKKNTWLLISFIVIELVCAIYIQFIVIINANRYDTYKSDSDDKFWVNFNMTFAYVAMVILAFIHGLITSHFLSLKPDGVNQE